MSRALGHNVRHQSTADVAGMDPGMTKDFARREPISRVIGTCCPSRKGSDRLRLVIMDVVTNHDAAAATGPGG